MYFTAPYLDRLPSERIIESRHASLIIQAKDYGLSSYVLRELNWLVGMKGKKTVRGWFFLTNYRMVFRAYARNRLRGQLSIFLPTIQHVSDTSVFISKRITVTTKNQRFEFFIWSIAKVIAAINSARSQLTPAKRKDLRALVAANLNKCSEEMQVRKAMEVFNLASRKAITMGIAAYFSNLLEGRSEGNDADSLLHTEEEMHKAQEITETIEETMHVLNTLHSPTEQCTALNLVELFSPE